MNDIVYVIGGLAMYATFLGFVRALDQRELDRRR